MTANRTFAVHSLDHARLSARKFAQQHVFPHISAAFPIWRPRMFLSSAIHDKPPRGADPRRASFSRNRRKRIGRQQGRWNSRRQESGAGAEGRKRERSGGARHMGRRRGIQLRAGAFGGETGASGRSSGTCPTLRRRTRKAQAAAVASVVHNRARELALPRQPLRLAHAQTRHTPIVTLPAAPYPVQLAHPSRKEAP